MNRPDWDHWSRLPSIELWQACALSFNVEPESLVFDRNGWMAGGSDGGPYIEPESLGPHATPFGKRIRLLWAHMVLPDSAFSPGTVVDPWYRSEVQTSEFANWLQSQRFDSIPSELEALATTQSNFTNRDLPVPSLSTASIGEDRRTMVSADWPILTEDLQKTFEGNLSDVPNWLIPGRVSRGKPGGESARWNPGIVGALLVERKFAHAPQMRLFIGKHFADYLSDYEAHIR